ncbi:MAG TPA: cytochrome c3 family protein [Albitalea sp.]|nr:cytochrome c3 family protein [Albitalea sp.]
MTRSRTTGVTAGPRPFGILRAAAAAIALSMLGLAAHAAEPKKEGLSKEDKACLECHAKPTLEKTLGNGEKLSLHVAEKAYADSVHGSGGCDGCHSEIDAKDHGKDKKAIASKREESLAMTETCRDCHKKVFKQYDDSVHAALVREGNKDAPVCSDCHNPHATKSTKGGDHTTAASCQACHKEVVTAYAASVHGQSSDEALDCKDCHRTHSIKVASSSDHLKGECLSCHRDTAATHTAWLPNAERHLETITCSACHSPDAKRRVNLSLYEGEAKPAGAADTGVPQFMKLTRVADSADNGLNMRALWSLLQEFNHRDGQAKSVLHGRLEVQSGVDAHRLAAKGHAVKACDTCHRAGAEPFQSVTVTMTGPDGRPLRQAARKGLLNSVESIESVGGFYAIGGTRIKLLDTLLLMALAAGIGIPMAHLSVKLISRRAREREAAAQAAAGSREPTRTPD